jgi:excisionase family DNA binding protein
MKENPTPTPEVVRVRDANRQELKTFLTSHELARYLRVSLSTIRNRVKEGSIPFTKVYGKLLFDLGEVNAWVAEQREVDRMVKRATVNKANRRFGHHSTELPVVFTLD